MTRFRFSLFAVLSAILLAQGALVPTLDEQKAIQQYDDSELRGRIEVIEKALSDLGIKVPDPEVTPVKPEEPKSPVEPDRSFEPPVPPEPEREVLPDPHFDKWSADPRCIGAISYRSQSIINKFTVNVKKGSDPKNNESIRYDPEMDAGRIKLAGSLSLTNRSFIEFPIIKSGMLVCVWDFHPSIDWQELNKTVDNHKWTMLGCNSSDERRRFEMRQLKYASKDHPLPNTLMTDVRPYIHGVDITGKGSGLGRLTPYNLVLIPAGKWGRYLCSLRFDGENAYFSYGVQVEGEPIIWAHQDVFIPRYASVGVDFFDPTWCNTSQPRNAESITYGWLRNAVVLWDDEPIDLMGAFE